MDTRTAPAPSPPMSRVRDRRRPALLTAAAGLVLSATLLALAPLFMPSSYSVVAHTTSESAGQAVDGAWFTRLGFLLFGFAVLWLAMLIDRPWGALGKVLHGAFGVFMISTAAFAALSWDEAAPFADVTEDLLHSIASGAVGFAFTVGVLAVFLRRPPGSYAQRLFDLVAVAAAVGITLLMANFPEADGALQRAMFLIAYVWYGSEALAAAGQGHVAPAELQRLRVPV